VESFNNPMVLEQTALRRAVTRGVRVLLIMVTVVNFLGPCAAGMWLALHGFRFEAGIGLCFAVVVPFVWSWLAFRPSAKLAGPLVVRGDLAHPALVTTIAFIAAGWQYCVLAGWTLGVFLFFEGRIGWGMPVPMLVWVYGTVMGPLSFMACNDREIDSGPVLALGFALAAFGVILAVYLARAPQLATVYWLAGLVVLGALVNALLAGRTAVRLRRDYVEKPKEPGGINRALYEALRH
jgi:hypothetical protein